MSRETSPVGGGAPNRRGDHTVTKTHATITVRGADVSVTDRAATNGTLLQAPDGTLVRCRAWQQTTVRAPAIIHLGRTRLHVRPAAARRPLEVARCS